MEIIIGSELFKKKKFRVYSNNVEEIEYIAKKYKIPKEQVVSKAILSHKVKDNHSDELHRLRSEIDELLKEMFRLESKWAGLRYRAYLYLKENKSYAISLAGVLARNKNIRHLMKMDEDHKDVSELVDKYLWK